jgi:hypothetical protein
MLDAGFLGNINLDKKKSIIKLSWLDFHK